ncbi:uncharacterized protein METZ01_LOCUS494588, partial [marine metagenome]
QFNLSNVIITGGTTGLGDGDINLIFNDDSDIVIGLSTTDSFLPATTGDESNTLAVLNFLSPEGLEACLSDAVIAYTGSIEYPVSYTNDSSLDSVCITPCMNAGCGCDAAGPSGCDNVCNSTAVVDECGICGGTNVVLFECWDGSCSESEEECPEEILPDPGSDCICGDNNLDGIDDCDGYIFDCTSTWCVDSDQIDDGSCQPLNNCEELEFDGGDCEQTGYTDCDGSGFDNSNAIY